MGLMLLKKISLLLLISASLLSTSLAGRGSNLKHLAKGIGAAAHEEVSVEQFDHEDQAMINKHERLLRVNTKDYGKYDPAPGLVKPPFKLIPN